MAREIDLTSREWCNVIFEGKHQEYGAYLLRETSSRRHVAAFFVIVAFALFALSGYYISRILNKTETSVKVDSIGPYVINRLDKEKQNDVVKPVLPERKEVPRMNMVTFVKPVITEDDRVTHELEPADKINSTRAAIGNQNITDGVDPGNGVLPVESPAIEAQPVDHNQIVDIPEQNPLFPGGDAELFKFLSSNILYPQYELENEIQGKVVCQFVVGLDGSIQDITVLKGVSKGLDREAMRVIGLMPKWIPGKQGGTNVRVRYMLPVTFRIQPQ